MGYVSPPGSSSGFRTAFRDDRLSGSNEGYSGHGSMPSIQLDWSPFDSGEYVGQVRDEDDNMKRTRLQDVSSGTTLAEKTTTSGTWVSFRLAFDPPAGDAEIQCQVGGDTAYVGTGYVRGLAMEVE